MGDTYRIDDDGTVRDALTGETYGRVVRVPSGNYWVGLTRARVGMPADKLHRETKRAAALAVVATYLLGPEE